MTFAIRVCAWTLLVLASACVWHLITANESTHDLTQLAVAQFQNSEAVPERLQQATLMQGYWPLAGPVFVILIGGVLLWEDLERRRARNIPS